MAHPAAENRIGASYLRCDFAQPILAVGIIRSAVDKLIGRHQTPL